MPKITKENLSVPPDIDENSLKEIIENKKQKDSFRFPSFYTSEILYELYYLWKTYDLTMLDLASYGKKKYSRNIHSGYLKKRLLRFEKNYIFDAKKPSSEKEPTQYSISNKKTTKTNILDKTKDRISTSVSKDILLNRNTEKTLSKEEDEIVKKTDKNQRKSTKKGSKKPVEQNCAPKKTTRKNSVIKNDNDSQNSDKETLVADEVISQEDTKKIEIAGEKAKKMAEIEELKRRKFSGEKLTIEENRILWEDTVIDFSKPPDSEAVVDTE